MNNTPAVPFRRDVPWKKGRLCLLLTDEGWIEAKAEGGDGYPNVWRDMVQRYVEATVVVDDVCTNAFLPDQCHKCYLIGGLHEDTCSGTRRGASEVELVWMVLSQRVHPSGEVYYQVRARANIGRSWEVEEWRQLLDGTWRLKRWLGPSGASSHDEVSVSGPGPE